MSLLPRENAPPLLGKRKHMLSLAPGADDRSGAKRLSRSVRPLVLSHARIFLRSASLMPRTSSTAARFLHPGPSPRLRLGASFSNWPHRQQRKNSQVLSDHTTMYSPDHRLRRWATTAP